MTILILCAVAVVAIVWSGKIKWPRLTSAYICWSKDRKSAFVFYFLGNHVVGNLYRDDKCVQNWVGDPFEARRWCLEQGLQEAIYEIEDVTHPNHVVYRQAKKR